MSVAIFRRCSTVRSTTTFGIAPIVPLLKNTLSRASINWSRTLLQYAGSDAAGIGCAPPVRFCGCARNGTEIVLVSERRKLRRPVIRLVYSRSRGYNSRVTSLIRQVDWGSRRILTGDNQPRPRFRARTEHYRTLLPRTPHHSGLGGRHVRPRDAHHHRVFLAYLAASVSDRVVATGRLYPPAASRSHHRPVLPPRGPHECLRVLRPALWAAVSKPTPALPTCSDMPR